MTEIQTQDELLAPFYAACKPKERFRVGTEAEKFGVFVDDGRPVPFDGPASVRAILTELVERHGWTPRPEVQGGEVIELRRNDASITLEPGGQLELSGAPQPTIHHICSEFRGHITELRDISDEMGIVWLGLGFHPFATQADLPWVPKLRYRVMREYLPTRGSMALDMMRRTCTVQANFDYENETDATRKLRVGLALQPIVTAIFANSPFVEGRVTGEKSHRARVWLNVDPDRSGLLPFVWEDTFNFRRYVDWALDVPMFLIKREGRPIANTGQTFRQFLADGFSGFRATATDWETHLNTLFPEVRLKNIVEVRGADGQATALTCALPALWKGIFYDETSLAACETIASRLSPEQLESARSDIADRALGADLAGRPVVDWAREVFSIAKSGLTRIAALNRSGEDETIHLRRLSELLERGQCPADALLAELDATGDFRAQLLDKARIL